MGERKEHLVLCDCGFCEHQMIASYFDDDDDQIMYLQYHLYDYQNFFQRLISGIRYIFGHKSRYGQFDDIILNKSRAIALVNFILNWASNNTTATADTASVYISE